MIQQVERGRPWEGTFATRRVDGSRVFVRAHAAPLRGPGGEVTGVVLIAREAVRHGSQSQSDRIGVLERIGERLAGSLELSVTLRQVSETLVPQFADHCFIDLLQGDKLVRREQFHSRGWMPEPGTWALVGEPITYPEGHFCQLAMEQLDTIIVEDMAQEKFPPPSAASGELCDDVGLTSVMAAPLIARGELLGVISLALSRLTDRREQHYSADDRDFLSAVASRVAVAIDNAMLFEEERRTALAFQTSLLPLDAPSLDGLEVAYKYVPAKPLETHGQGIQTQVGGDWYDIIPLSAGRVGIVIGDVEGRGARAAAAMGQLRAALRAFAQDDKPPAEILRRLDDWCRTLVPQHPAADGTAPPDPPTVSCTYLVYDAWSRILSFANAGHMPPLLISGTRGPAAGDQVQGRPARRAGPGHARACRPTARSRGTCRPAPPWSSTPTGWSTGGSGSTATATTPTPRSRTCSARPSSTPPAAPSRASPRPPSWPCRARSTTTWPSSWSAPRRSTWPPGRAGSRPSRSGCPRPGSWPGTTS